MAKSRPPYPPAFRRQRVELARTGRTAEELAREWRCCCLPKVDKYADALRRISFARRSSRFSRSSSLSLPGSEAGPGVEFGAGWVARILNRAWRRA